MQGIAGPIQGPGEKPPDPDPDPDELSDPNQIPSHRAHRENTSLRGPSLRPSRHCAGSKTWILSNGLMWAK